MKLNDNKGYNHFFSEVITTINSARYEASKSLNRHLVSLNFEIGRLIVKNQEKYGWGKSIIESLSKDINQQIDGIRGYSSQNLWKMRQYYLEYKDQPELFKLSKEIPWGHNILIINKIKDKKARKYYLKTSSEFAWSRTVLLNQIKADAYGHHLQKPKQHNFNQTLPENLLEQADEALKSEYNLDFLGISKPVLERELENRLIESIRDFLMELGYGFCFIGNQYRLKLNQKEYFIDLLFYHRILKCLVAIELKTVEFEPEFAGKMNFYLELIDEQLKQEDDNATIGIILCPEKDHLEVEYALRSNNKPIGVSEYKLTHKLPKNLEGKIPNEKELKRLLTTKPSRGS